jgi:RecQ family ATP-dependent DNA helicase
MARSSVPQPDGSDALVNALTRTFGHATFRAHQYEVCRALVSGDNALLVMPTGAGKSLCYQLPGLVRQGVTLVICPLIALIEDQVASLRRLGLRADAIHSGRPREDSRAVCTAYVRGDLDYLFFAPERLAVRGFPEFLSRRVPALIAIDEAHCISEWGHDFRPDYRLLRERLGALMPAPIVALTATATSRVQQDIIDQLGLSDVRRYVYGFRRDNIAIEITEAPKSERASATQRVLAQPGRRPAIVYAPTRSDAEKLAVGLRELRASAYHAGMAPHERAAVQNAFLRGDLQVVVATVAFGMGVDKADVRTVIHTAMPGTVEGYYQEIGRAGRDGKPSRAILWHSRADAKTHAWFFERDYPAPQTVAKVTALLTTCDGGRDVLIRESGLDAEVFDKCLEKLVNHGGMGRSLHGRVNRTWLADYTEQRRHRQHLCEAMLTLATSQTCRMLQLVHHFGDQQDSGAACGLCDICAPDAVVAAESTSTELEEQLGRVLELVGEREPLATGRLYRDAFDGQLDKQAFEALLEALVRADYLVLTGDEFVKDGRLIRFKRAQLTQAGRTATAEALRQVSLTLRAESARPRPRRSPPRPGASKSRKHSRDER